MEILFLAAIKPLFVGMFVGIVIGLTGIGGGVLVMPSLIYILGVSPVPAIGTGLLYAFFSKIIGLIEHHRLKNVNVKTALFFTIGSAPATILSSRFVNYFSCQGKYSGLDSFLQYLMGSVLIATAILFLAQNAIAKNRKKKRSQCEGSKQKIVCILFGCLVGTLIGSTSIGGGVLVIPILMIFFGLTPAATVGTSILISIVPTILGSTVYLISRNINFPVLLPMLLGAWPGTVLGSRLTRKVPEPILKRILMTAILAGIASFFWGASK
jgi:uncharacterized membrane protein YfcA